MAHIFFERLEKRQSTQTFFPGNTAIAIYSAPLPDSYGWGSIGYNPFPQLLYGISPPTTNPIGGYYPWGSGFFGISGYSPYNPFSSWTNPFSSYNPWGSWGSGSFFPSVWNYLGGLFGGLFPWSWGSNYPSIPDIRLLYGIPSPIQPTPITYYGVGIPSIPSVNIPPSTPVYYYGVGIPNTPPVDVVTYNGLADPTKGIF